MFKPSNKRIGASIVECAITLPVMFLTLFTMLDLGLASLRYNTLAEAARQVAREVVLHGSLVPPETGSWGPDAYSGTFADDSQMVIAANAMLPTMQADLVTLSIDWLDVDNTPGDRVRVEVGYEHQPTISGLLPWGPISLRAVTTMEIVN